MAATAKQETPAAGAARPAWKIPSVEEFALWTRFEGREALLGQGLVQLLKTVITDVPYQHHLNDAVVKAHLVAIQFAKNQGLLPQLVEHDIKTLSPINRRIAQMITATSNPEYGLVAMFERTDCFYQLVLEWKSEPGRRHWRSPFRTVLEMGGGIGQFDLTEREVHEQWTTPRLLGYARDLGIQVTVSPWSEDGWLTCELAR